MSELKKCPFGGYRETKDEAIIAWNKRESKVEHDA